MAKDVRTAVETAKAIDEKDGTADRSREPGFKKTFTLDEQTEISAERLRMRQRLFGDG